MNDRITVKEAAEMLGVSVQQVRYWIRKGIVPGYYLKKDGNTNGTYLVYKGAILAFKGDFNNE